MRNGLSLAIALAAATLVGSPLMSDSAQAYDLDDYWDDYEDAVEDYYKAQARGARHGYVTPGYTTVTPVVRTGYYYARPVYVQRAAYYTPVSTYRVHYATPVNAVHYVQPYSTYYAPVVPVTHGVHYHYGW